MSLLSRSSRLYNREQAYALEAAAIASGVSGIRLMKRAARAAQALIIEQYGVDQPVTIYTGGGNNGGDGWLLAALLRQRNVPVQVRPLVAPEALSADAAQAYEFAQQEGVVIGAVDADLPSEGVIVDALLGLGAKGPVRESVARVIDRINQSELPVIALDLPSGVDASTGAADVSAIQASVTITFLGLKIGLVTGRGAALAGDLVLEDLEIDPTLLADVPGCAQVVNLAELLDDLPARARDAHKGDFGRVLVIGGERGFGGAALMAAEAAARVGAGCVSIATRPEHVAAILARRPEVMATGVVSGQELEPWLERPTHLVVGPGLGRTPWSEQMLQQAVKANKPLVLDADALNILAEGRVVPNSTEHGPWLLTPHPAEAARLLGVATETVQADRLAAAQQLAQKYNASVILKGAGSLVVSEGSAALVLEGNPGMATAGMGDILSGILGGLWAQGLPLAQVAQLGASLHAAAADLAAEEWGQRSLLATDVLPYVCELLASAEA